MRIEVDESVEYPETEAYGENSPFLFMDIVKSLKGELEWSYEEANSALSEGKASSDEIIEEHFLPLEHKSCEYFQEYRVEISEDGQVILEKNYPAERIEEELSVENIYSKGLTLRIKGEIGNEELENLSPRL